VNRETKRMMQRQGALGADGEPVAGGGAGGTRRPPAGGSGAGSGPGNRRPASPASPKADRPGIPERSVEYLREVRSELQKVAWPGRSEVVNYTAVVLVTIVFMTLFVFGLDFLFAKSVIFLFRK
jgi:preprotein translocase subunit SecE